MRQNRDIINKKLIPEISKSLGKSAMSYRLGGSLSTSYNSSDVNDFDKKDTGEIIVIDPKRSYLTTTLYPVNYIDSLSIQIAEQISGRFTDNLYASLGDVENYSAIKGINITGNFKVALKDYWMVRLAQQYIDNSVQLKAVALTGVLRDVLKKYTINPEYSKDFVAMKAVNLTATMRSVLILYSYWAAEKIKIQPTTITVSSVVLDGLFESYVPFDALDRIIDSETPSHSDIDDKASITWAKTGNPIVQNSTAKEGKYSLYLDGNGSSIKSQESLEYVPSDNESLIIENWLKPDHMVASLLTRYGGTNSEKGLYYDYAQNTNWVGSNANTNTSGMDYLFTNDSQFLESNNASALILKPPTNNPNGQTLELNVKVNNMGSAAPIILLSNKNPTWLQSTTGKSAAIVWYSPTDSNPTLAGKIALVLDNTTNTNAANGIMLISGRSFPNDSVLQIALVAYGNYVRLFVNGTLEAFEIINSDINLSYNGTYINKCLWNPTNSVGNYRLYSLRFTNFALYINDYIPSNVYSPRGIPKLKTLSDTPSYPEGISCGVRYISNTTSKEADKTIIYASLSDGQNVYIAESVAIDPLKWNHVKLSIFKNIMVLYVNGIAYSSETIPFDIELESISVGNNTANSFSGYVDNFKMYKDQTFDLEGAKYLEVRPYLNGITNTALEDFNDEIKWTYTTIPTISSVPNANTILGYMIDTTSTNPQIKSENVSFDTINFGVRIYFKFASNQTSTLFKKGQVSLSLEGNVLKATTNGTTFVTSPELVFDTLYKAEIRYASGYINLLVNDVQVLSEAIQTTINSTGSLFLGWDGVSSLFSGYVGPFTVFDNNRNRIPAIDMIVEDFTPEKYYKNTVLSISSRDNVYNSQDSILFDNSYSSQLNDVVINGAVINSTITNGFFIQKDSYLKINSNSNFVFGTDDFTIEFDVSTSVTNRRQVILDRYFNGIGSWQVSINTDGNIYFTVTDSNSSPYYYFLQTTQQTVNDGEFHKVFIVRKGVNLSIYVDNVLADSFVMSSVFNFSSTNQDLYIGSQRNVLNENYNFEGYLNNIRITKGSLETGSTSDNPNIANVAVVINDTIFNSNPNPTSFTSGGYLNKVWTNNGVVFDNAADSGLSPEIGTGSLYIADSTKTLTSTLTLGQGPWSICFDMKMNTPSGAGYGVPLMWFGNGVEGAQGFALESFVHSSGGLPYILLRNAYSSMSAGLTMPVGQWFKVVISKLGNTLTLKLNDQSSTLSTTDFISEQLLTIGNYNGQWLQNRPFYIDNFRIYIGEYNESYVNTTYIDPYENPTIENYNPTQVTSYAKTLRTFDTDLLTDSIAGNSWTNSGTSINNNMTNKSSGSLRIPFGAYQISSSNTSTKLSKTTDFCIEFSFYLEALTGDSQCILSRGAGNYSLSYGVYLDPNATSIRIVGYSDGTGGSGTTSSIAYKFELHRWYEVAICNKSNFLYFLVNGQLYIPLVQITNEFHQVASTDFSLGQLNFSGYNYFFNGYIDSLRISSGTSVYTKALGEDNAYISSCFRLTNLPQADNVLVSTISDTGVDKLPVTLNNVKSSRLTKKFEHISSGLFNVDSYIKDNTNTLFKLASRAFSIHTELMLTTDSTRRYLIYSSDSTSKSFDVYIDTDNRLYAVIKQNGEVLTSVVSSVLVPSNKWITIGFVRTNQHVLRLYLNGVIVGALNNATDVFDADVNYYIGHTTNSFVGYMNYMELYKSKVLATSIGENKTSVSFDAEQIKSTVLIDSWDNYLRYSLVNVDTVIGIDGKYTASGLFNGLSSYVKLEPFAGLNFASDDFDIEFEIYPTDGTNNVQTIYCGGNVKVYMYGSNFGSGFNNRVGLSITDANGSIIKSLTQLYFDKWTFVRITKDGSSLKLYLDGVLDSAVVLTNEVFDFGSTGSVFIGKDDTTNYYKGYISTFKLAKGDIVRNLSSSKYKVISALDFEGNTNQLVIRDYNINYERFDRFRHTWAPLKYASNSADPILKTITSSNEACYLQGQQGFIYKNKHTHISFNEFTLEVRFMLTASSMTTWRRILDQSGLYSVNITSDRRIEFNGGTVVLQSSANAISNNKWYHVAVTRDANMITRLFLDGVKVSESSLRQNYSEANHYPICLGMYYSYFNNSSYLNNHFQGYLDNFYMISGTCKYVNNFIPNIPSDTVLANTSLAYVVGSTFTDTNSNVIWNVTNMSVSTAKVKNKTSALYSNNVGGFAQTTYSNDFIPGYEDFTVDFILCPTQVAAPTTIFDNRVDGGLARGMTITQPTGNTSSFTISIGSSNVTTDPDITLNTGINSISVNTYYHLRVTRNLGKIYVFLDGVLKTSADYVGDIPGSGSIILANRVAKNQGFTGYIEQFRYLKRTSLAGTSFTPFTQELI